MNVIKSVCYVILLLYGHNASATLQRDIVLDPRGRHNYDITSLITDHSHVFKAIVLSTKKVTDRELKDLSLKRDNSKRDVFKSKLYILESYKDEMKKELIELYYYAKEFQFQGYYSQIEIRNTAIRSGGVFVFAVNEFKGQVLPEFILFQNIIKNNYINRTFFDSKKIGNEFKDEFFLKDLGFRCYKNEQAVAKAKEALAAEDISYPFLYSFRGSEQKTIWEIYGAIGPRWMPLKTICIKINRFSCEYEACDGSFPKNKKMGL